MKIIAESFTGKVMLQKIDFRISPKKVSCHRWLQLLDTSKELPKVPMDSSILSGLSASLRRDDQMKKTRPCLGCSIKTAWS